LKSIFWSLPIYFMSLFTILASLARRLEKIMRDFLWYNNESSNGSIGGSLPSQVRGRAKYYAFS